MSKQDSLSSILDNIAPDIVSLNELKLKFSGNLREFFKQRGYQILSRTSGGIAIAVSDKFQLLNVTSSHNTSILSGLIPNLNTRIIVGYGPQEKELKETREAFFDELSTEVQRATDNGNNVIILGDLNAKLEKGEGEIGYVPQSPNGELLAEMLSVHGLEVLNFNKKCTGRWTRVQEVCGETVRSVLDYCISSPKLANNLESMMIDEEKVLCPFRVKKSDGNLTQVYSDHNALLSQFNVSVKEARKEKKVEADGWKITSDGLLEFQELTTNENKHLSSVQNYSELENEIFKLMDTCFEKRKKRKKKDDHKITDKRFKQVLRLLIPFLKKGKVEKEVVKLYIAHLRQVQLQTIQEQRIKRIRNTIDDIQEDNGQLSIDQFWKLRKRVLGYAEEPTSIVTKEGIEVFNDEAIVNEYRKEFVTRLSHRKIHPDYAEYQRKSMELFKMYMELTKNINDEADFTFEEVNTVLQKLKSGKAYPDLIPPDIYKHAGPNLAAGITNTLNNIKNNASTPDQWDNMVIKPLYKNKGSRKVLKFHRGIFLTVILSKVLERLLLERAEVPLKNINSLQYGSQKGKGVADVIFITNGLIDHALYLNKSLYITSYDFATCFDSLWLEDCLLCLRDIGVSHKILHLLYELNKRARITVKTPLGKAPPFTVENIVKQGSVWGSKMCCSSTAEVCDEDVVGGASIDDMTIHSTVYVDDCNRFNSDVSDAELSHERFINFTRRKRAPLNAEKCVNLTINKQPHVNPPTLIIDDHIIEEVDHTKILGDSFNRKGDNTTLIDQRVNLGHAVINSLLAMCTEATLGSHRIEVMILLYHSVFLQTILSNAQSWSHITEKDLTRLRTVQLKCLKRIMRVPSSTPNAFMFLELGVIPIEYEIHKKQLTYLHSILRTPNNDPLHRMYDRELLYAAENNWANCVTRLKSTYHISSTDVDIAEMSKETWKNKVKKAVIEAAHQTLTKQCKAMSKTTRLSYDKPCNIQNYLVRCSFEDANTLFKLRSRSTNCRNNRGDHGECRLCGCGEESQNHCINCPQISHDNPLSIAVIYGDIDPENEDVREVLVRFNRFEEAVKEIVNAE